MLRVVFVSSFWTLKASDPVVWYFGGWEYEFMTATLVV